MPEYLIEVTYRVRIAAPDKNVAFDRAGECLSRGAESERMTAMELPTAEETE